MGKVLFPFIMVFQIVFFSGIFDVYKTVAKCDNLLPESNKFGETFISEDINTLPIFTEAQLIKKNNFSSQMQSPWHMYIHTDN